MRPVVVAVVVAVCCWAAGVAQNNNSPEVIFAVDHPEIIVNLTHALKMSCNLDASSNDARHLVSIVITRLDKTGSPVTVASVSTFDSKLPEPLNDTSKITVDNTSSVSDDLTKSYLKLEWTIQLKVKQGYTRAKSTLSTRIS